MHTHAHKRTHIQTHTPTHTHSYIHAYMHTYIHTYIQTHTSSTIFLLATATVPAPVMCTSKVTSYALGPEHSGQHYVVIKIGKEDEIKKS